jgi:hypothetical protein
MRKEIDSELCPVEKSRMGIETRPNEMVAEPIECALIGFRL